MSYCRISDDSDVYIIKHKDGRIEVIPRYYQPENAFDSYDPLDVINHLYGVKSRGGKVPTRALHRLREEASNERH